MYKYESLKIYPLDKNFQILIEETIFVSQNFLSLSLSLKLRSSKEETILKNYRGKNARVRFSKWLNERKEKRDVIFYDLVNRWKEGEENRERSENEMRFGYFHLFFFFSFPVGREGTESRKREIKANGVATRRKIDLTCGREQRAPTFTNIRPAR